VLEVNNSVRTLIEFSRRRHFRAGNGSRGGSRNKTGARGSDIIVLVPPGTVLRDEEGTVIADLVDPGQKFIAASGGQAGRGNAALVKEVGPLPRFAEKGEPGDERAIKLELKLVADVAIVGFPNAGKSSLISKISRARPRVADYPFTTIEPNLGVATVADSEFVVTDVPGLIKGAHEGRGMGIAFLRHIERAAVILYLVDMSPASGRRPVEDLVVLEDELESYNPDLIRRSRIVAANKMDLKPRSQDLDDLRLECEARALGMFAISAATGDGIPALMSAVADLVQRSDEEGVSTGARVAYEPAAEEETMSVTRSDGLFVVTGVRVERLVKMTDWSNDDAITYLARKLREAGVDDMLARAGAHDGDEVEISTKTFEYSSHAGVEEIARASEAAADEKGV